MKQAVMFGAGNIGRGFIGALLELIGWNVTFADLVAPLLKAINTDKHYTVHILDQVCDNWEIENISAVSSIGPDIVPAIASCDLVTTAVGPVVIPRIAKPIAEGIKARMAAGNKSIMNIVCCENGIRVTSKLKADVMALLNEAETAFADECIGFADCAVDRICPKPSYDNPLDAAVEQYMEWDVERSAWKGEPLEIMGMTYVDNLMACLERKLFTLNSGHAICAYLGALRGRGTSSTPPCGRAERGSSRSSPLTPRPTTPTWSASSAASTTPTSRTRCPAWAGSPSGSCPPWTGSSSP